jgi:hypothetical protein
MDGGEPLARRVGSGHLSRYQPRHGLAAGGLGRADGAWPARRHCRAGAAGAGPPDRDGRRSCCRSRIMVSLVEWQREIQIGAGLIVIGMGVYLLINRRHPRFLARIRPTQLALWSFAVAMAHGAGLMLVPIFLGLCRAEELDAGHSIATDMPWDCGASPAPLINQAGETPRTPASVITLLARGSDRSVSHSARVSAVTPICEAASSSVSAARSRARVMRPPRVSPSS